MKDSGASLLGKVKTEGSTALASMKTVPKKMNDLLDNLIEEVAYFFVSICVIPIVVLILLVILMKQLLGFNGGGSGNYSAMIREIRKLTPGRAEEME